MNQQNGHRVQATDTTLAVDTYPRGGVDVERVCWGLCLGSLGLLWLNVDGALVTATGLLFALLLAWSVRLILRPSHVQAVFSPGRIEHIDATGEAQTLHPERLVLRGEIGQRCRLYAGKVLILSARVAPRGDWTPSRFLEVAQQAASCVGVPLIDESPREVWQRWENDPLFRREYAWNQDKKADRKRLQSFYEQPLDEPEGVTRTLHGYTLTLGGYAPLITVNEHAVLQGDTEIPLTSILDTHLNADPRATTTELRFSLDLLLDHGIHTLLLPYGEATPKPIAKAMLWLARDIRHHAQRARARETEAQQDVPSELTRLTQQR